ncbi:uncharacterized protein F4812DRAFT_120117 [Daldinia caldariorum]|uniref:uncharacterized protein n=1 Tax=Daldinia caldariorum TaxID=326644 RepID=UPI0020083179|nr:uncharacterized protein F4812DRAFT_120117 [Daldinia caldariorum]KAI1465393.1 hypothetical protein F4812DRAFT_120117 [Daldinia caldariorum]
MALVDYSSDSDSGAGETVSASAAALLLLTAKRQKKSHEKPSTDSITLPPLPDSFHDLYASTVRVSTSDDPALHQGRKRVNPHRAGSWPSHLYIEWHPTASQRTILSTLLSDLQTALTPLSVDVTSFLTSDLGAPQPLHISLSRPVVLSTAEKDRFLEQLVARIGSSGVAPFDLAPRGLEWHRTSESERSFLVLRVGTADSDSASASASAPAPGGGETKKRKGKGKGGGGGGESSPKEVSKHAPTSNNPPPTHQQQQHNRELSALLQRCNALVQEHDQPPLYAFSSNTNTNNSSSSSSTGDAFHISLAWTFAPPTPDVAQRTQRVFAAAAGPRAEVLAMRVPVRGVKAKIGNAVTFVELPVRGKRGGGVGG